MRGVTARILRVLLWIYVGYLLVALLLLLPALNIAAPWAVREYLGRELQHDIVVFNPFTLSIELRGASIHESDGHVPMAVGSAGVSLSTASLWRPGIVLDRIRVEDFMLHVLRYADGSYHFEDLLAGDDSAGDSDSVSLPGITIDSLYFGARELRVTDRTRRDTYSAAYRDFAVDTRNISTLPGRSGAGELTLTGADGGEIRWRGNLGIADAQSTGTIQIEGLDLTHIWRYESERLRFVTYSALIDLNLDYRISWQDDLNFALSNGRFRAHKVTLLPLDPQALPNTSARVGELLLDGIEADSGQQRLTVNAVKLGGSLLQGFAEGERSSLVEMFTIEDGAVADAAAAGSADDSTAELPWHITLNSVSVTDTAVEWRTNNLAPEAMAIRPLRFDASDISWPATAASPFALAFVINDEARIAVNGELHLGDGVGDVSYSLEALPIPWINPVLHRYARADITGGLLSLAGAVTLDDFAPATAGGDLSISRFAAQVHGAEESALSFEEFSVTGASVDMGSSFVDVEDVGLLSLRGALHILEDGSFNATSALIESPEEASAVADEAAPEEKDAAEEPFGGWGFRAGHIGIRDGRVEFSDASLPLPFQTLIGDVEADIEDLDSSSGQPMVAVLNGAVDGYAPVVIEARGTPLAEPRDASLTLDFRGMDIATMSPYSGTYAGYTIDSGTLSLKLRYGVQGSVLDGDNRIIISQMELGEPIESDIAMQLPLQLGIALLTDPEGVIDLDIPISGDVEDPDFSLGPVIGRAIANVIVKAATAPFRLLAGLVGSDEDLENIPFASGSSELTDSGRAVLGSLAAALQQRPQLQLRIVGSTDPAADRQALRNAALNDGLIAEGISAEAIAARSGEYLGAIDARYAALALPAPEDGSTVTLETKLESLLSRIELPPGTLQDLGTDRATEAKRELVTVGGVDAARIAVAYDRSLLLAGTKMSVDG